jgi:hypothetical protein
MFGHPYNWPSQNHRVNPAPKGSSNVRPTSVSSAAFLKRDFLQALVTNTTSAETKQYAETLKLEDTSPAELEYYFEDMDGNEVDVKDRGILYDDCSGTTVRLHDAGFVRIAPAVQLHDAATARSDSAPTIVVSTEPKALIANTIPTETGTGQVKEPDRRTEGKLLTPPW